MTQPHSHLAHANDLEPSVGASPCLRGRCPLHVEESHAPPFFVVSRHADVFDVLTRPKEWRNGFGVGVNPQPGGVLGTTDDPDHRRQRRVLQDAFRPVAIERLDARSARWATICGARRSVRTARATSFACSRSRFRRS